jgi:predicted nucleic acid-binding protein
MCLDDQNFPQCGARLSQANVSVEELVLGYASLAITVRPEKINPVITADPDDDKVLACAKAAKAEVIASGDPHLLDLNEHEGIKILTVNQLLEQYP